MSVQWDGSSWAIRDLKRKLLDCVADLHDDILYVKTEGNPYTPVPYGHYVSRLRDGIAIITKEPRE